MREGGLGLTGGGRKCLGVFRLGDSLRNVWFVAVVSTRRLRATDANSRGEDGGCSAWPHPA
jgi:hypothetical protein